MTADEYAKVIEAALAKKPTPGPWRATMGIDQLCDPGTTIWHRANWGVYTDADCHGEAAADAALLAACHPEAMRALLEERKAMRELLSRAAGEIAGLRNELGCTVGGRIESTDVEHAIKAALTTTADNQEPPKGQ